MNIHRRRALEQHVELIDGINTVVAEAGQVIPAAYDHLVPDHKAEFLDPQPTVAVEPKPKPQDGGFEPRPATVAGRQKR
ncbi:MAG: hypothetical protein WKF48_05715 [Solirubrobacteraceae bacterium]